MFNGARRIYSYLNILWLSCTRRDSKVERNYRRKSENLRPMIDGRNKCRLPISPRNNANELISFVFSLDLQWTTWNSKMLIVCRLAISIQYPNRLDNCHAIQHRDSQRRACCWWSFSRCNLSLSCSLRSTKSAPRLLAECTTAFHLLSKFPIL